MSRMGESSGVRRVRKAVVESKVGRGRLLKTSNGGLDRYMDGEGRWEVAGSQELPCVA